MKQMNVTPPPPPPFLAPASALLLQPSSKGRCFLDGCVVTRVEEGPATAMGSYLRESGCQVRAQPWHIRASTAQTGQDVTESTL